MHSWADEINRLVVAGLAEDACVLSDGVYEYILWMSPYKENDLRLFNIKTNTELGRIWLETHEVTSILTKVE